MKGRMAQLKFRQHPVLGTIAAFDQFGARDNRSNDLLRIRPVNSLYFGKLWREGLGCLWYDMRGRRSYMELFLYNELRPGIAAGIFDEVSGVIHKDILDAKSSPCNPLHRACAANSDPPSTDDGAWMRLLVTCTFPIAAMFSRRKCRNLKKLLQDQNELQALWNYDSSEDVADAILVLTGHGTHSQPPPSNWTYTTSSWLPPEDGQEKPTDYKQ